MQKTLLILLAFFFSSWSHAADIQSASIKHQGNPIIGGQIKIDFEFLLKNGKKRYTSDVTYDYAFDNIWPWYKIQVESPQALFNRGYLVVKRAEFLDNDHTIDVYLSVKHSGQLFRDTFHIPVARMEYYRWEIDSIRPYQWNPLTLITKFTDGDTMVITELPTTSIIQYDDFIFRDSSNILYDNGFIYYEPRIDTVMEALGVHSVNIAYQKSSHDTFPIVKHNHLMLYLLGDNGLHGYNGRNGQDGGSGEHGGNGENGGDGEDGMSALDAEFILTEDSGRLVLMMYQDSTVSWYPLGENALVEILALGGNGGDGGRGGRGGDGGSSTDDYEAGDDGNGGSGGKGGNGGNGGNITVITDLDIRMLHTILAVDVSGGMKGKGGVRGYGERIGKNGKDGSTGKQGVVQYIILPRKDVHQLLTSYR